MTKNTPRTIERVGDVAVIGGSAAGLAAAIQLGRQRRSVIVVDAGEPRNAPAARMHSFLGRDGEPPSELTSDGRADVRSYGGEVLAGRVERVSGAAGRFRLELANGHAVVARRVLIATGVVDELPEIEGLAEHWGGAVVHCPFCHGYEFRDQRIVQLLSHPMGFHAAPLIRQLSAEMTAVVDAVLVDDYGEDIERLRRGGVDVEVDAVERIVNADDGSLAAIELRAGRRIPADAVFVMPRVRPRIEAVEPLGLDTAAHPSGLGTIVVVDERGETSVPGIFAAGNVVDPAHQVLQAAADGSRVGAMISIDLATEELDRSVRSSANEAEWDRRYDGDAVWSGNPNGTLVAEVDGLQPGRALDVGAGEGADAIWLAQQGWSVTASDVSGRALDRVAAAADRHGLDVVCQHADANALDAFGAATFDLVAAQYAAIPRTADHRGVENLLGAVADGGTLLVVGHARSRTPTDPSHPSSVFDRDAYLGVDRIHAAVADRPEWSIEVFEERPRPAGSATAAHHPDDVVLRARRTNVGSQATIG